MDSTVTHWNGYWEAGNGGGYDGKITLYNEASKTKYSSFKAFIKDHGEPKLVGDLTYSRDCLLNLENIPSNQITLYNKRTKEKIYSAIEVHHTRLYTGGAINRVHVEAVDAFNGTHRNLSGSGHELTKCNTRAGVVFRTMKPKPDKKISREINRFILPNIAPSDLFNSFNSTRVNFSIHVEMDLLFMMKTLITMNCRYRQEDLDLVNTNFLWLFFDKSRDENHRRLNISSPAPYSFAYEIASIFKTAVDKKVVDSANSVLKAGPNEGANRCHHQCNQNNQNQEDFLWTLSDFFDNQEQVESDSTHKICLYCYLRLLYVENTAVHPNTIKVTTTKSLLKNLMKRFLFIKDNDAAIIGNLSTLNQTIQNLCHIQRHHMEQNHLTMMSPAVTTGDSVFNFTNYSIMEVFRRYSNNHTTNRPTYTLYHLFNNFGKMTLIALVRNIGVCQPVKSNASPITYIKGRYFDIEYNGPNPNNVQVYEYQSMTPENVGKTHYNIDALRRIPSPQFPNGIGPVLQLKTFVRDSVLRRSTQSIHLIDALTNQIKIFRECHDHVQYDFQTHAQLCHIPKIYRTQSPSNLCLEVTNYEQFQDQISVNGNAIGNRILRQGKVRDGSRVLLFDSPLRGKILIFESLTDEKSKDSDNRYLSQVRVGVYDIETMSLDAQDENACITSVGFVVVGKESKILESYSFVLGKRGVKQKTKDELVNYQSEQTMLCEAKKSKNEKLCPSYTYMEKAAEHVVIVSCKTERDMIVNLSKFMNKTIDVDFITGYNIKSFDHPYLFYRACKVAQELFRDYRASLQMEEVITNNIVSKKKRFKLSNNLKKNEKQNREKTILKLRKDLEIIKKETDELDMDLKYVIGFKGQHGLFDLEWLIKDNDQQNVWSMVQKEYKTFFTGGWDPTHKRLTTFQKLMSASVLTPYFDIFDTVVKNYSHLLSLSLDNILKVICGVEANQKMKISADELLRYKKLNVERKAKIHVYCLKDCWLTAYLQKHLGVVNQRVAIFKLEWILYE